VKHPNTGGVPNGEHPELYKPEPKRVPTKGELEVKRDIDYYKGKHAQRMKDSDLGAAPMGADGQPMLSPKFGMG
jgi:hypothetical protein